MPCSKQFKIRFDCWSLRRRNNNCNCTCFQRTDFLVFFSVHYLGWSHFNTTSLVERRPRIVCLHEPGRKTVQHLINTFSHHFHRSDTHAAQEVTHVSVGTVNLSRSQNNYGGFEEVSFSFCCTQRSKSRSCCCSWCFVRELRLYRSDVED